MELFDLLKPEAVRVITAASSKKRLLQDISEVANISYGFEGDLNLEGQRGKINGWKAEGLPWSQR